MNDYMGTRKSSGAARGLGAFASGMASSSRQQLARIREQEERQRQEAQRAEMQRVMMQRQMEEGARNRAAGMVPGFAKLGLSEAAGEAYKQSGLPGQPNLEYDPTAMYRARGSAAENFARDRLALSTTAQQSGRYDPAEQKDRLLGFNKAVTRLDQTQRGAVTSWRSGLENTDWTKSGSSTEERLLALAEYFQQLEATNLGPEGDAFVNAEYNRLREEIFSGRGALERISEGQEYLKSLMGGQ